MACTPALRRTALAFVIGSLVVTGMLPSGAQAADAPTYQTPPKAMADLVDAPRQPSAMVSHDDRHVLFASAPGVQTLADVSKTELKLGGIRINPANHSPSRAWPFDGLRLRDLQSGEELAIALPSNKLHAPLWSPDSQQIAVIVEEQGGLFPYVYDLKTRKSKRLDVRVNASLGMDYQWTRDGKALLIPAVAHTGPAPAGAAVAPAPVIQISSGQKSSVRTYQDLLKNPADEALFKHYTTAQLMHVPVNGKARAIGKPGIFAGVALSPDGKLLLVDRIEEPFSYAVPYTDFPTAVEVWDLNGKLVKTLANIPLQDNLPQGFDSVVTGPRNHFWRADAPATVMYAEAQDGGDMAAKVAVHDRVYAWEAPFTATPQAWLDLEMRFAGIRWGDDQTALVSERRFKDRMMRVTRFAPAQPQGEKKIIDERSYNDAYRDPGTPAMKPGKFGTYVMDIRNGDELLLTGLGASPKGNVPFLDRYSLKTGEKKRVWQSEEQWYERVAAILDDSASRLLILRESPSVQPNFHIRDLKDGSLTAVSSFPHPTPYFANVKKELVKYKRKDGVELSGNLYLPPDYQPGKGPLPVLMWAYPLEFKDASTAGQVKESPYQFNRVSYNGPLAHLAQGFAVFDDPKMPIIGAGDALPNDSFREQLVAGAQAAIDVLVERGIADPKRVAIGGHSYGAFMTANLLAHSDLFATGIARSGAYNRTLTPFGFQGEERNYWEAQKVYNEMSPFNYAEKINEPMLMIHGEEDNNSGTFPIQSQRMYAAMAGLGGNARLVMLPHEQHGYRARESILHMLWEQYSWLETHVKNKQ